jgi:Zn-dependent metalloprotease
VGALLLALPLTLTATSALPAASAGARSADSWTETGAVQDADGATHVRYQRSHAGLPVVGGDVVVHRAPDGSVLQRRFAGPQRIALDSTTARVAPQQASDAAARRTGLESGYAAPRLVVYALDADPVLAWETTVRGADADGTPIEDLVYVDATSGRLLGRLPQVLTAEGTGKSLHNGTVRVQTMKGPKGFRLVDKPHGLHATYDARNSTDLLARGRLFRDGDNRWGDGTVASRQSAAVDAAYGAAETWDLYKQVFKRSGIKDDGDAAISRVHYGNDYQNAFWYDPCFCMTYGDGGSIMHPLTSLDVAGHEMSHGLTSATAGLIYSGEPGGLNESTSDVFGTMVEFRAKNKADRGDYFIGETIMKDGSFLRRMDDPSADGVSASCWDTSVQDLDPHYSSGVGNHFFYLLAEGTGTKTIGGREHHSTACDGSTVRGIGRLAAAQIWYRALTVSMTSTTTYSEARDAMVAAAAHLYGADSRRCTATMRAWNAVDVTGSTTCASAGPG